MLNFSPRLIRTLNTRLVLVLFSVSLIPLIISGFLVNQYLRLPYLDESIARDQQRTQTLAFEITHRFERVLLTTDALATYIGKQKDPNCLDAVSFLPDWLLLNSEFAQIQVLDLNGNVATELGVDLALPDPLAPTQLEIEQAIEVGTPITKFVVGVPGPHYDLTILRAIENPMGQPVGLLHAVVPLEKLAPPSGSGEGVAAQHIKAIVDLEGRVRQHVSGTFRPIEMGDPFLASFLDLPSGENQKTYRVQDNRFLSGRLITASYIEGLDLILMADRPLHEQSQLSLTLGINFVGLVLALTTGGGLIVMMTRSLLLPITRLAEAAEGLASGDAAIPLPDDDEHDEEVARLIRAFDQMRTAVNEREYELRQISAQLEDRVVKRTAALINFNRRLEQEVAHHAQTSSKLRDARDESERANRAKSAFLARMSHELRTPLSSILGYGDLLRELSSTQTPVTRQFLEKIHGSATHLLEIINDILDLAKIEAGRIDLFESQFVVTTLIEDVVDIARPLVAQQNNTLTVEWDEGLGFMVSDEIKVRQVLLNLLSNAAKFTENGQITLHVTRRVGEDDEPPHICFAVQDTGIGMNEEQLGRLFQPFTQVHSGDKYYRGTGLGLSLSFHFCQLLGGALTVTSAPDVGSTFTACLPQDKKAA